MYIIISSVWQQAIMYVAAAYQYLAAACSGVMASAYQRQAAYGGIVMAASVTAASAKKVISA